MFIILPRLRKIYLIPVVLLLVAILVIISFRLGFVPSLGRFQDKELQGSTEEFLAEGREIFRYDTFGDEEFWGQTLRLHEAIKELARE